VDLWATGQGGWREDIPVLIPHGRLSPDYTILNCELLEDKDHSVYWLMPQSPVQGPLARGSSLPLCLWLHMVSSLLVSASLFLEGHRFLDLGSRAPSKTQLHLTELWVTWGEF
jgi:hypothetical protein